MATIPPKEKSKSEKPVIKHKGLILIHTGDGKGKTTAALGVCFRAAGNKMRAFMVQFIKGNWKYGELEAAKKMDGYFEIQQMGEGFTWDTKNPKRDKELCAKAWQTGYEAMMSGKYDVVVFDEINYVIDYNYLDVDKVAAGLKEKPPQVHVILTGRNAHPKLIELADLVTEMKEVKHPFKDQGVIAQRGIEF